MANGANIGLGFLEAFQQARKGVLDRQQQAEENELTRQLRQIQMQTAQKQLIEASKTPQQRFIEKLNEAVALDALKRGSLTRAPAGLEGETIYEPFAIQQTAPQLAALEAASQVPAQVDQQSLSNLIAQQIAPGETAGVPSGTDLQRAITGNLLVSQLLGRAPGASMATISEGELPSAEIPVPIASRPEFQIPRARPAESAVPLAAAPGFISSPAAERESQAAEFERLRQTQEIRQRPQLYEGPSASDPSQNVRGYFVPGSQPEGFQPYLKPSSSGDGGLTPNARANVLAKAGTAGITQEQINTKYTQNGVTDYDKLILDSNRTISQDKKLAAEEKSKQIPAADRSKATGFIAAYDDLNSLVTTVKNFQVKGREPGAWQRAVGTALESPPDGVFSALYQSSIGQSLTADDRQLNALKARVRGAVTKANAGLSQTEREIANVTQYVPTTNDTFEQTLQKASGLQEYIKNQVTAITTDPRDWLRNLNESQVDNVSGVTTGSTKIGRFTVTPR